MQEVTNVHFDFIYKMSAGYKLNMFVWMKTEAGDMFTFSFPRPSRFPFPTDGNHHVHDHKRYLRLILNSRQTSEWRRFLYNLVIKKGKFNTSAKIYEKDGKCMKQWCQ